MSDTLQPGPKKEKETILQLVGIHKNFGSGEVLSGIDLDVSAGEFLTLLGPSGCGKTTTLRIIAGLEEPSSGSVLLGGKDVTRLPPEKRSVNTVFQNYALFPHMTVAANIGYGLKIRKYSKDRIKEETAEMLRLVQMEGFEKRMPHSLSGGQRQRVAIARAVVLKPKILLLDEPLGALDLQLRRQMQTELKALQESLGITFIYITHDQEEALNMSDRIAVMRDGVFEQVGSPEEIYEHPVTRFTASFIGQTNLLECTIEGPGALSFAGHAFPAQIPAGRGAGHGMRAALCLRMERILFGREAPAGQWSIPGDLVEYRFAGGMLRSTLALPDGQQLIAYNQVKPDIQPGSPIRIWWDERHAAVIL